MRDISRLSNLVNHLSPLAATPGFPLYEALRANAYSSAPEFPMESSRPMTTQDMANALPSLFVRN